MILYRGLQRPGGAVLAVFDGHAERAERVAYLVAGGPVFVGFGGGAHVENHLHEAVEEGGVVG